MQRLSLRLPELKSEKYSLLMTTVRLVGTIFRRLHACTPCLQKQNWGMLLRHKEKAAIRTYGRLSSPVTSMVSLSYYSFFPQKSTKTERSETMAIKRNICP